jgi:hypothetical protein
MTVPCQECRRAYGSNLTYDDEPLFFCVECYEREFGES